MYDLSTILTTFGPLHLICLTVCISVLHERSNRRAVRLIRAMRER